VKQLGNKSVSWIRRRDAHILTVDRYTFIADERFQAFLVEASNTWTLQVDILYYQSLSLILCMYNVSDTLVCYTSVVYTSYVKVYHEKNNKFVNHSLITNLLMTTCHFRCTKNEKKMNGSPKLARLVHILGPPLIMSPFHTTSPKPYTPALTPEHYLGWSLISQDPLITVGVTHCYCKWFVAIFF
jgi:hypothetical protein